MQRIERLLTAPCYLIDLLPRQVPKDCGGQFFAVETYLLNHYDRHGLQDRFLRILLKLLCYYPASVHWGRWIRQPSPEQLADIVETIFANHSGWMDLLFPEQDALLRLEWDCLHLAVYGPDEEMRGLLEQLARSEGMFFRAAAE